MFTRLSLVIRSVPMSASAATRMVKISSWALTWPPTSTPRSASSPYMTVAWRISSLTICATTCVSSPPGACDLGIASPMAPDPLRPPRAERQDLGTPRIEASPLVDQPLRGLHVDGEGGERLGAVDEELVVRRQVIERQQRRLELGGIDVD